VLSHYRSWRTVEGSLTGRLESPRSRPAECQRVPQARTQRNVNPRLEMIEAFGQPFQGYASFSRVAALTDDCLMKSN